MLENKSVVNEIVHTKPVKYVTVMLKLGALPHLTSGPKGLGLEGNGRRRHSSMAATAGLE